LTTRRVLCSIAEQAPPGRDLAIHHVDRRALVVGATGISGGNAAQRLLADGFEVVGLSRRAEGLDPRVRHVAADLEDGDAVAAALRGTAPTHVFFTTWSRRATEAENCDVNGRMLRNLLDAVAPERSVRHVALVTGLKHYLGPFEAYAKAQPDTPFSEDQPRLPYENFYYVQEDILFAAAERDGFTWSVHRPHTLIGWALGNAMNMGVTLAVYAAICRETGRGFHFPGSREQWEAVTDITDARLLADHLAWAATTPAAANRALNIVNGDVFRWRRLWPRLAAALGVEPEPFDGDAQPLEQQMAHAADIWPQIVRRHGLRDLDVGTLASWWHTDADLGRTVETFTDMGHSRRLGFIGVRDTESSFTDLFARLRDQRIVP
jgi:nucleoside-diphosphate-sugar epimerase